MRGIVDEVLEWVLTKANWNEKKNLLRRICDALPEDELRKVPSIAAKAKKRRKRKEAYARSAEVNSHSKPEPRKGPAQELSLSAPRDGSAQEVPGWFRKHKPKQFVAIDIEKVEMIVRDPDDPNAKPSYEMKAGSVAIVDYNENLLYKAKIFRPLNSYRTTVHSYNKNGFTRTSLQSQDCKPLELVMEEVHDILNDKIVIGVGIENDLQSLDLPIADYEIFDIQWHYYLEFLSPKGRIIREVLGLRSLCKRFFNIDIQPDHVIHEAEVDAAWTMNVFRYVYTKIKPEPVQKFNPINSNGQITHFKQLYI